jgi:hypothetical protein
MDEQVKFWINEYRWPRDIQGYTFLCRAVLQVGKTIYGNDWTNTEPSVILIQKLPQSELFMKPWQLIEVHNRLRFARPELQLPMLHGMFPKPHFTVEQWAAALDLYDELNKKTEPCFRRFNVAKLKLFEVLANGQVGSCLRPLPGGEFSALMPVSWWNTERWGNRFYWGQMSPKEPFRNAVGGDNFQWIFIESVSLNVFLDGLKKRSSPTAEIITKAKRGPKPKFDKNKFEEEVHRILDYEGWPDPSLDAKWNQTALEKRMAEFAGEIYGETHNRTLVKAAMESFRQR